MNTIAGRTALVTGATSGIGWAAARLLSEHGIKVIAVGRRADRLAALQKELPHPCLTMVLDVSDTKDVQKMARDLPADFADLSIVVNNAGLSRGFGPAHESYLADWEEMLDTNVKGVLACTHAFLPRLITSGTGHIINIGSVAGNYPYHGGNVYAATKAFINHLSLSLRVDLANTNVRVTSIEPGMTETEFALVRFRGDAEMAKALYKDLRPLRAEDVAQAILWSISQPSHVNINRIELMPVDQPFGLGFAKNRATTYEATAHPGPPTYGAMPRTTS